MTGTGPLSTGGASLARRGRALIVLGVVLVVLGLVGAAALSLVARSRVESTVRDLARAPVGCDTTLDFSASGTFVVYVETVGRMDELVGGCDAPSRYDRKGAALPDVAVEVVDPAGRQVDIGSTDHAAYDLAGYRATPLGEIAIDEVGRHVVRVTSPESDFVVSVGRDPFAAGRPVTVAAIVLAGAFVLAGGILATVGVLRGRGLPPSTTSPPAAEPRPADEPWRRPVTPVEPPTAPPPTPPPPGAVLHPPEQSSPPGSSLPPPSGPPLG